MNDRLGRIISLIFMMRQLSHEHIAKEKDNSFSFLQFITLRYIKEKKPLMKEVAEFLAITPPSATSLIKTLSEVGLIKRLAEKNDRRIVRIVITKKGERGLDKWQKKIAGNMRKRLESLDKGEQDNLVQILTKLSKISK
jgi:DNA-binding MarR family transcriptional regulator